MAGVRPGDSLQHDPRRSLWQGRILGRLWYMTQIHSERSDPPRAESAVEECSEPTSQNTLFFFLNSAIPLPGAFSLFSSARVRTKGRGLRGCKSGEQWTGNRSAEIGY